MVCTETPTKVQSTLKDVQELSQRLSILENQYSDLKVDAQSHLTAVSTFLENVNTQLHEIERLELEYAYLKCMKNIEDLRYANFNVLS